MSDTSSRAIIAFCNKLMREHCVVSCLIQSNAKNAVWDTRHATKMQIFNTHLKASTALDPPESYIFVQQQFWSRESIDFSTPGTLPQF